jgi:hypothetical protein
VPTGGLDGVEATHRGLHLPSRRGNSLHPCLLLTMGARLLWQTCGKLGQQEMLVRWMVFHQPNPNTIQPRRTTSGLLP